MKVISVIIGLIVIAPNLAAQVDTSKHKTDSLPGRLYSLQGVERNGEVLPEIEIREVTVFPKQSSAKRREYRQYERHIYNIKRVYPYALVVRERLKEVNDELQKIEGEKARKDYLREVEKDVFVRYEDDMRKMTITQGKILIKLIDRETQNTSYTLIREYRGKFSAAFWQGVARIFGTNLKAEYDPYGEDALTEAILIEIEAGRL